MAFDRLRRTFRSPHAGSRFAVLDGYRAFAAMAVVVFHVAGVTGLTTGFAFWPRALNGLGNLGVSIFFVLSGFLLFRPYVYANFTATEPKRLRLYIRHRMLRILPGYWFALTGLLLLLPNSPLLHFGHRHLRVADYLTLFSLTMNLRAGFAFKGLAVAWTLHLEVLFYLTLPLIAFGMATCSRRLGGSARVRLRTTLAGLGLMAIISVSYRTMLIWWWRGPTYSENLWLLNYLDWFAVGMLLATAIAWKDSGHSLPRGVVWTCRSPSLGWLVAAMLYVVCIYVTFPAGEKGQESMYQIHMRYLLFGLIALALLAPVTIGIVTPDPLRQVLSSAPVLFIGTISYGVYLWHTIIRDLLTQTSWWAHSSKSFWFLLVPTMIGTVAIASVSYYLIERPLLRFKDTRTKRSPSDPDGRVGGSRHPRAMDVR